MSHTWGKADIEAKLLTRDEGSPDRGEYRQAAGVFAEAYFYLSSNSGPLNHASNRRKLAWGRSMRRSKSLTEVSTGSNLGFDAHVFDNDDVVRLLAAAVESEEIGRAHV